MAISSGLGSSALLPAGLGFRNLIMNGDMRVAQRGASTTGITTAGYYTTDRWYLNLSSAGTWTMAQTTDAPTSEGFGYSTKLTCTTAQASPATTNNARFWQKIEGNNVAGLAKGTTSPKPLMLSFWVKSGLTGTFICTLDDLDNSRKISASYTINVANTWEKKTISFVGDTTGSFVIDNSEALMVQWWLVAGPSFQGSSLSTSWSSGSTLSDYANGQTNVASGNNASVNYWQITGVQLEQNYQPTPFEQRPIGVELYLCRRYYESSYELGTAIGTATENNCIETNFGSFTGTLIGSGSYAVTKRVRPTVQLYATNNGNSGAIFVVGWGSTVYGATIGTERIRAGVGTVTGTGVRFHYTADAEL